VLVDGAVFQASGWRWPDPMASLVSTVLILSCISDVLRHAVNLAVDGCEMACHARRCMIGSPLYRVWWEFTSCTSEVFPQQKQH
jgi:hypothetical protein